MTESLTKPDVKTKTVLHGHQNTAGEQLHFETDLRNTCRQTTDGVNNWHWNHRSYSGYRTKVRSTRFFQFEISLKNCEETRVQRHPLWPLTAVCSSDFSDSQPLCSTKINDLQLHMGYSSNMLLTAKHKPVTGSWLCWLKKGDSFCVARAATHFAGRAKIQRRRQFSRVTLIFSANPLAQSWATNSWKATTGLC